MPEERTLRRDGGSAGVELIRLTPHHDNPEEAAQIRDSFKAVRSDKVDLFVYGTMMNDHHVRLLFNRKVDSEPAILHNYMRVVPPGAFFFIVKQHGAVTQGRLLKDLTREELARIDAFEDEGNLYYRKVVVVRTQENRRRRCMIHTSAIFPRFRNHSGKRFSSKTVTVCIWSARSTRFLKRSSPTAMRSRAVPSANSWDRRWTA